MLTVTDKNGVPTPTSIPICASTQKVAFVVLRTNVTSGEAPVGLSVFLLDSDKKPISFDRKAVAKMTPAQVQAFKTEPAVAGDTLDQTLARRALPILTAPCGTQQAPGGFGLEFVTAAGQTVNPLGS